MGLLPPKGRSAHSVTSAKGPVEGPHMKAPVEGARWNCQRYLRSGIGQGAAVSRAGSPGKLLYVLSDMVDDL